VKSSIAVFVLAFEAKTCQTAKNTQFFLDALDMCGTPFVVFCHKYLRV
jgi:hypothetical protein